MRDIQRRLFESKKEAEQSIELRGILDKLLIDLICTRKKHQLLHNALVNAKFRPTNVGKLMEIHQNTEEEEEQQQQNSLTLDEKKKKFDEFKHLLDKQVREILCYEIKKNISF